MSPPSKALSASSKAKINRFSPSPDSEPSLPEPDILPASSKKKKKNAASKQAQNNLQQERVLTPDIGRDDSPPTPPPARLQTILSQLPHGFSATAKKENPLLDIQDEELTTSEKVSDQYTPPNDAWLAEETYNKSPPVDDPPQLAYTASPPIEPGFSTKTRNDVRSPPISPPVRKARPISYGGTIPPIPPLPRGSPSAFSYAPSAYGSPPAPHLPQQHFYNGQDINIGPSRLNAPYLRDEPLFVRHMRFASSSGTLQHGVLLGFDGRLSIACLNGGVVDEVGGLEGLSGTIIDAAFLQWRAGTDPLAEFRPLVAIVIHGPKEVNPNEVVAGEPRQVNSHQIVQHSMEYTTRVEVYSLSSQTRVAILLETSSQVPQSVFRGTPLTTPNPIGQLRVQASGAFLTISSGVSGEVYAFTYTEDPQPRFECIGKFWTSLQPQTQRRDSSHHQLSDIDISPADLGRAAASFERAIYGLSDRWLAISSQSSPSRPSLGATLGSDVIYGRQAGVEMSSAPSRPPTTCEVDSPDVDTLFGKVARGVAQELVKGAKWLGDQGYQTWQSYWKKEQSPSLSATGTQYSPPVQPALYAQSAFPPTHGDTSRNPKEPEIVAIYDLQALVDDIAKRTLDELRPLAAFQPPRGCSYLSFAPQGLMLLTSGRKGDVQYVWDLMQIKNCRTHITPADDDRTRYQPRVRQVAKYERLSGSTLVDVIWDTPAGASFAVLTKNKTVHLFSLPTSASRWPPPRIPIRSRPSSRTIEARQSEVTTSTGFFASAINIANQAQPMIANWRGRAPSMGGGLAGIGQTGIGLASATGAKGGKAVAAGLSKSLGAASDTVHHFRHAGESRLHLKKEAQPGRIFWLKQGMQSSLAILDLDSIKLYQVRQNSIHDKRDRDNAIVFAARKALVIKLPNFPPLNDGSALPNDVSNQQKPSADKVYAGFWRTRPLSSSATKPLTHPLSFAEIETNAPYQPFHSDRRVTLSVYADAESVLSGHPGVPTVAESTSHRKNSSKAARVVQSHGKWVFGDDIPVLTLNISKIQIPEADDDDDYTGSIIYRETVKVASPDPGNEGMDQIVSTTRRRKIKKMRGSQQDASSDQEKEEGFFEDDCDVLDFATDRV